MLDISSNSALIFLPFCIPIAVWVAFNDMKFMKIPNLAVLCLMAIFLVVGLIALPLDVYLQRCLQFVVILIIGFIANMLGFLGAGDAKFAAAMAPFVALADVGTFLILFAISLLAAFATHRLARKSIVVRNMAKDWESWNESDFPMGLTLGSVLVFYLFLGVLYGT
ncbi:MAG: prepilin peptidase [Pseudoruegeria sp.]